MAAKSPRSNKNQTSQGSAQDEKRNLINSLELLRGGADATPTSTHNSTRENEAEVIRLNKEVETLRKELKATKSANSMLESDLQRMEQKALETIAENGSLKRLLDEAGLQCCQQALEETSQREDILNELSQSRNDHFMLTQALIESENEITRLSRTLEKLSRKLYAA